MKNVFRVWCCFVVLLGFTSLASAADKTWTGKISDSMCGASHAKMIAEHGGSGTAKMTDRECTQACIKAGGKYVFVTNGKVDSVLMRIVDTFMAIPWLFLLLYLASITTLDVPALAGDARLQWDLPVTIRAGETTRI